MRAEAVFHPASYRVGESGNLFESRSVVLNPDFGGASLREGSGVGHGVTPGVPALGSLRQEKCQFKDRVCSKTLSQKNRSAESVAEKRRACLMCTQP